MPDTGPCPRCHNPVDREDLFCDYCGSGLERDTAGSGIDAASEQVHTFHCTQCAATMRYDEKVQQLRCAFCGSVYVDEVPTPAVIQRPEEVIPFDLDREQAVAAIRSWLGRGFWRPGDLAARAHLTETRPVYLPCWSYDCMVDVHWTADSSQTPPGADADWCPCGGRFQERYRHLLVPASGAISRPELRALLPFDRSAAVPWSAETTRGSVVEAFALSRKRARPLLLGRVEELAVAQAQGRVPGRSRNVHVNLLLSDTSSRPVLLPVWIAAYRYRERPYRVVLNGQSGRLVGFAPTSWVKVTVALALAAAVMVTVLALVATG